MKITNFTYNFSTNYFFLSSIFQVYKIENTAIDVKPLYIAENSLYLLIKNESALLDLAKSFEPLEYEKKFDKMLEAAIEDYPIFLATKKSTFEAEVMINFEELFDILIDIKKKMAQEVAAAQAEQSALPTETERVHGKNKKNK